MFTSITIKKSELEKVLSKQKLTDNENSEILTYAKEKTGKDFNFWGLCSETKMYFNHNIKDLAIIPEDAIIDVVLNIQPELGTYYHFNVYKAFENSNKEALCFDKPLEASEVDIDLECVFYNELRKGDIVGYLIREDLNEKMD